jgi:hypothetical protein
MKVRLSSASSFLPEEGARNAFFVDFQQVSMVGFFYHFRAWSHLFSGRPAIGRLP